MFTSNSDSEPIAIITNKLYDNEWDFLQFALFSSGLKILFWNSFEGTPYLEKGQVLLINGFSETTIKTLRDWSIDVSIVGRLEDEHLQFLDSTDVISFWNLDKYSLKTCISHISARSIANEEPNVLLWTGSERLNSVLLSLFRFYSIHVLNANNPELALYTLDEKEYDLLVLDWDYSGLDVLVLIREMKKLKELNKKFPIIIGIKDFDKPNIFKDLSAGIRDFSPVLFNKTEVWELFTRSLPLEEESPIVSLETESPMLKKKDTRDGLIISLDYLKESRILRSENFASWNELDKMSFRRQFEWVKV